MSEVTKKYVGREVIESKLLTALEDENTVAILASKQDLKLLIFALDNGFKEVDPFSLILAVGWQGRRATLTDGLNQLLQELK